MISKRNWKYGLILLLSWGLIACDSGNEGTVSETDYSNCRYERPEAIFYDGLPQISDHKFTSQGRGSEESFLLSGSIKVTIFQYGCDYRTQEFRFEIDDRNGCETPEDCARQIAQLLHSLSRLGPEYHVFRAWSQAIKNTAPDLAYDKSKELAEGFYVKIDQRKSFGSTTLMLTLSEKP